MLWIAKWTVAFWAKRFVPPAWPRSAWLFRRAPLRLDLVVVCPVLGLISLRFRRSKLQDESLSIFASMDSPGFEFDR